VGVVADSSDEDGWREKRAMACFFARRGGERRLNPTSPLGTGDPGATDDPSTLLVSEVVNQPSSVEDHSWRFLTNHAHVLECIAGEPTVRLRDIAASVGITERAAASIVNDLVEAGYLTRTRIGRRNKYDVHDELPLRHPLHRHHTVGELIRFLQVPTTASRRRSQERG
jgi:hypothetical protein